MTTSGQLGFGFDEGMLAMAAEAAAAKLRKPRTPRPKAPQPEVLKTGDAARAEPANSPEAMALALRHKPED